VCADAVPQQDKLAPGVSRHRRRVVFKLKPGAMVTPLSSVTVPPLSCTRCCSTWRVSGVVAVCAVWVRGTARCVRITGRHPRTRLRVVDAYTAACGRLHTVPTLVSLRR
jgi:hypothetical protein